MTGQGLQLLEDRLIASKKTSEGVELDPATISLIITLITTVVVPMIQQCFAPKPGPTPPVPIPPARLRQRFPARAVMAGHLRRELGMGFIDSFREANNVFDLADQATDAELNSLIDDCCCSSAPTT